MSIARSFALFAAAVAALFMTPSLLAHGGGLDRNGCHTNRKTGEYHCHGSGRQAPAPPSSTTTVDQRPATPNVRRASVAQLGVQSPPTNREQDLVRTAQVLLRALGYQPSLLGALDERTRAAVRAFQRAEDLDANGVVTEYLVLRLAEKVAAAKCP